MPPAFAGSAEEHAGRLGGRASPGPALPEGPRYPRFVQAMLWLKQPTWFLDHCSRTYGEVFTMRLPLGTDLVHISSPELVKAVFGGSSEVLLAGEANATILLPIVGPNSVLVLDGPEHLRQRKLILPAFHGDRMRAWEATVRDITRAEIARWPAGKPFALRRAMQSITLEVIVKVVFGVDDDARRADLRRQIVELSGISRNPLLLFATRDRKLGPRTPWARFLRVRDALHAALAEQIQERRHALGLGQRTDVLSLLVQARDEQGKAMTDVEVRDELVTLRFAGQAAPSFGWFPFGGGIRRCIGASFATFEMGIVIPEVLRAVTLRPASRRPARIRREAVTFVPRGGARCVVTARTHRLSAPGERSGPDAGPEPRRRR